MALEREALEAVFENLGATLTQAATLCIIGSSPAILLGQASRQTQDIDIWDLASNYHPADLARACESAGVLYDPKDAVAPDAIHLRIVRPGVVALPRNFETEKVSRYGLLTLVMPAPVVLLTAGLARGSENDVNDIVWWTRQRSITLQQLERTIEHLSRPIDQETARENLIFVRLIAGES